MEKILAYPYPYDSLLKSKNFSSAIRLIDHLGGFDADLTNPILQHVQDHVDQKTLIQTEYVIDRSMALKYPSLEFQWNDAMFRSFHEYNTHPALDYKNFICSFNGSMHISRKLLTAILHRFNWFDPEYSSKNVVFTQEELDGHIQDYVKPDQSYYYKFFAGSESENFFQTIYSFGNANTARKSIALNIHNVETRITQSFLHLVSETMATSYYPFVTEKFLYSVITRGLFLSYAQPGWHEQVEKYLGFKRYTKLFDYRFDSIKNPVERLVELMSMISKFSVLSPADWSDLYQLEQDTIEYNYDHYYSKSYLKAVNEYVL